MSLTNDDHPASRYITLSSPPKRSKDNVTPSQVVKKNQLTVIMDFLDSSEQESQVKCWIFSTFHLASEKQLTMSRKFSVLCSDKYR